MWIYKPYDNPLRSLQPQNMFEVEEVNCICVDWKKGSQTTYTQAANNVRVVGAQMAQTLAILKVSGGRAAEEARDMQWSLYEDATEGSVFEEEI